jgi:hypothetical protein
VIREELTPAMLAQLMQQEAQHYTTITAPKMALYRGNEAALAAWQLHAGSSGDPPGEGRRSSDGSAASRDMVAAMGAAAADGRQGGSAWYGKRVGSVMSMCSEGTDLGGSPLMGSPLRQGVAGAAGAEQLHVGGLRLA